MKAILFEAILVNCAKKNPVNFGCKKSTGRSK